MAIGTTTSATVGTNIGANVSVTFASNGTCLVTWFDGTNIKASYASAPYTSWTALTVAAASALVSGQRLDTSDAVNLVYNTSSENVYVPFSLSGTTYSKGTATNISANHAGTGVGTQIVEKDPQGRYWAAQSNQAGSTIYVYTATTPGSSWTQNTTIAWSSATFNEFPAGGIVGNYLLLLYPTATSTFKYQRLDVHNATLGSWSTAATFTPGGSSVTNAKYFSFRGNSTAGVEANDSDSGIWASVYNPSTDTWASAVQLSSNANDAKPCVIAGGDGNFYVFWQSFVASNNFAIVYKKYTVASSTWDASATTLVASGANNFNVSGGASSSIIGIVYQSGTASPYNVNFATVSIASATTANKSAPMRLRLAVLRQLSAGMRLRLAVSKHASAPLRFVLALLNRKSTPLRLRLGVTRAVSVPLRFVLASLGRRSVPLRLNLLALNPSSYTVLVGNQPVFIIAGTLSVQTTIGRRGQGAFNVRGSTATHFEQDQQVAMYDASGTLVFSGFISQPKEQKPGFQPSLITQVQVVDNHRIADKRIIARAYTNRTRASIVQDIAARYLASEGVTVGAIYDEAGNVQTLYPSPTLYPSSTLYPQGTPNVGVINATFAYCSVAAALDALAQDANVAGIPYYWAIDKNKKLWWVPYTYKVNSTVIDGSKIDQVTTPATVTRSNPAYRNAQYIVGGVAQTEMQNETRIGDGNTTAWPMNYDLASTPTITLNSNPQTVGIQGVDSGKDWYWNQGSNMITQDSSGTKLVSTDTLAISYVGQFPVVVYEQNDAQIAYEASLDGTSGLVEEVEQDATITTLSDAISKSSGLLTRSATQGKLFEGTMLGNPDGYEPGQLVTVDLPMHGLNSEGMLIDKMTISDQTDGVNLWTTIDAVVGPYNTDWISFFGAVVAQQQPAANVNAGVSQSLVLLQKFTLSETESATLTATATACPLPSPTLWPSPTLYPC